MLATVLLAACALGASALATLPEHLSHGSVGRSFGTVDASTLHAPPPQYLTVPLDHFAEGGPTWRLKFFVDATTLNTHIGLLTHTHTRDTPLAHCHIEPARTPARTVPRGATVRDVQ